MKKFVFLLFVFALFFGFSHVTSYGEGSPDAGEQYVQKWYGPDGYIKLKDGKLYTNKGIYYPF